MQTSETRDFFGFKDAAVSRRGCAPMSTSSIFDRLQLHQPEVVHDMPAGRRRLVQRADGYRATLVAGTPIFENGQETGAHPGRLVRRTLSSVGPHSIAAATRIAN
jgi:N-acyl-D-aspartate/D-glutamate deacylase